MAEKNPGVKKGAPWGQYLMAYHCGSLPKGKRFDPSHLLTGEGWKQPPLGPGLYFSDKLTLTRLYCQYSREPTITTARLNMRGVFWGDGINGAPGNKERKAYKILRENFARWGVSHRSPYKLSIIKNGSAYDGDYLNAINSLHECIPIKDAIRQGKAAQKQIRKYHPLYSKLYGEEGRTKRVAELEEKVHSLGFQSFGLGHEKANRILVALGIKGLGVRIRPEALEIAIFDPANIEVLDARRTSVRRSKRNPAKKKPAKEKSGWKKIPHPEFPRYRWSPSGTVTYTLKRMHGSMFADQHEYVYSVTRKGPRSTTDILHPGIDAKHINKLSDAKAFAEKNFKKNATKKKVAKKKPARKKTPPWQLLINRCQKLWDHYCERPSKSRLKPVLEHLEKMKGSTSKKVADERKRCLRVANKEARRLKLK